MDKFENKKFAVILFLIGVAGITIACILSESYYFINGEYYNVIDANYALENGYEIRRVIEFFHLKLPFKAIVVFLSLTIATSIYLFIYKTDEVIKENLKVLSINTKGFTSKVSNSGVIRKVFSLYTSDSEVQTVKLTQEQSDLEDILMAKSFNKLFGVLLFVVELVLIKIKLEYFVAIFIIQIVIRFFGAYRCNKISEYNIWSSGLWFVLGFILPSISLFASGLRITLKENIKLKLKERI